MKGRGTLLLTCMAGAMIAGPLQHGARAQQRTAAQEPWWIHGEVEIGGRFFLNNPSKTGPRYLGQKSLAKYYEYSSVKPGPFSNLWVSMGSRDGLYQVDLGGKNIGYDDQYYYFDASKAGQHYFSFQWDQTPHLYSTSAQTMYSGVGSNNLTLPPGVGTGLFGAASGWKFHWPRRRQEHPRLRMCTRPMLESGAIPLPWSIGGRRPTNGTSGPIIPACIATAPRHWALFSTIRAAASSLRCRRP